MTTQTVETVEVPAPFQERVKYVEYSPALVLEVMFACERFMDTEAAYDQSKTVHTECEYFNASMNLVRPEWYAALLRRIDELEGRQSRKRSK